MAQTWYDAFPRIAEKGFLITRITSDFCGIYAVGKTEKRLADSLPVEKLISSYCAPAFAVSSLIVPAEHQRAFEGELFRGVLGSPIIDILLSRVSGTKITHANAYAAGKHPKDDPVRYIRESIDVFSQFGFVPDETVSLESLACIADAHSINGPLQLVMSAAKIHEEKQIPQDKLYGLMCLAHIADARGDPFSKETMRRNCALLGIDAHKLGIN